MSKHALSNEKESAGKILKKFMHVIGINHRLCKWILPCNLGKNIIMAGVPYVGIVYGCDILNALVAQDTKSNIMSLVYQLLGITFVMTLLYHILDKAGNAMRDSIRYRIKADISGKAASLDYQELESQESMQLLTAALEGEKESGGIYWFSDKLGVLIGDAASIFYAFIVLVPILTAKQHLVGNGAMQILNSKWIIYLIFLLNLCSMFLFMWISKRGNKKQYEIYEESLDAIRKDDYFYREILSKYTTGKEIRLYALKDLLLRDMTGVWNEKCDIQDRKLDIQEKIRIRYLIVQALLLVISYTVIGVRGVNGMITGAEVVKYVSALTALGGACQYMVDHFETVLLNMQYLHHYYEYLQLPDHKKAGDQSTADLKPQKLVITFEDVSFRYPGCQKDSLRHINLTFHYGEKIALVGPNGAGKTTLILLLCRLYEPTQGRILLNGMDIREYDYEEYLAMFGVVFQDFKLFAMTVAENVAASEEYDDQKIEQVLQKSGIWERVRKMKQGIHNPLYNVGIKGVEVSGGEAQKIAIARALYKNAPFIILDEPTSALDPMAEYEIYSGFDRLIQDRMAVYISHRMSSCRFCERIIVLKDGQVQEQGTHEELITQDGIYAMMWNAQAQNYQ